VLEPVPLWLLLTLIPIFMLIAGAYASVGLGGGSGYLAIMTLCGISSAVMPSTSLTLNLVASGSAMARYGLAGRLRPSLFLPFLLPAIPAAFLGGMLELPRIWFFSLLAITLAIVSGLTFRSSRGPEPEPVDSPALRRWLTGLAAGAAIGLLSGLLGIGGGIFLGPLVLLLRWAGPRETAAMTAAFIFFISASGLTGHGLRGAVDPRFLLPLAAAALLGGTIGAHLGATRLTARTMRRLLAAILLIAAIKAAFSAFSAPAALPSAADPYRAAAGWRSPPPAESG
jgi:uncharacterized membrane protein YfcA